MPIDIRDLDDGRGSIIICDGILTGEEYIEAIKKHLSQDPEKFKKYRYSLADYTAIIEVGEFPSSDVHVITDMCKQAALINPKPIIALVSDKELLFGLSRMWEILMEETAWDIMIFKRRNDAEAWIKAKANEKFGIEDVNIG